MEKKSPLILEFIQSFNQKETFYEKIIEDETGLGKRIINQFLILMSALI